MKNRQLKKDLLEDDTFKTYSTKKFEIYKNNWYHKATKFQQQELDKYYLDYNERHKYELANTYKKYEKISYQINRTFGTNLLIENNNKSPDKWNYYLLLKDMIPNFTIDKYIACKQIEDSRSKQRIELIKHINFWLENNYIIIFNTYTINDETLHKYADLGIDGIYINTKKLQDKLTRILRQYTDDYIGNVDYGGKFGRLHYHVLEAYKDKIIKKEIQERIVNETDIAWHKYGFTYPELINTEIQDKKKLSNYITKLTNHAIKIKANRIFIRKDTPYKEFKKIEYYKVSGTIKDKSLKHVDNYLDLLKNN